MQYFCLFVVFCSRISAGVGMKATIKTRIIISVLLCFLAVWFPSVLILFSYMNREVYREAGNVVTQQIENAVSDVNDDLFSVVDSIAWICSDRTVSDAFTYPSFETKGAAVAVMDAQSRIPKLNGPLELEDGLAYLMKTDILKETMYFSYDQSSYANLYPLAASEVREIIRMNRNGQKPESLKGEPVQNVPEFISAVGDDSITRFDEARRKRKGGKGKNRPRQQNNAPRQQNAQGPQNGGKPQQQRHAEDGRAGNRQGRQARRQDRRPAAQKDSPGQ